MVLSRQRDEVIMIGDDIEVTIVDIRGDKVRLGICAPTKIAVHRKEVYDALKREEQGTKDQQAPPASKPCDADSSKVRGSARKPAIDPPRPPKRTRRGW